MNARVAIAACLIFSTLCAHEKKLSTSSLGVDTDIQKKEEPKNSKHKKKQQNRKARGKKARAKTFSDMDYGELKIAKAKQLEAGNTDAAMKYLERMLKMCTDITELANLMVEYANMMFDAGKFTQSGILYTEFTRLYPGHEKTEYALYRAILCYEYDQLTCDRDQSKTQETIDLTNEFLASNVFVTYQTEVKKIRTNCYAKLIESELNVCDYYLKRGSTKAVENRLKTVRSDYLPHAPEAEAQIIAFELRMAEEKGQNVADHLANKVGIPAQEVTQVAQSQKKRKASDRF
jgi:outer membrane assembly lipoprotein YfiO